MNKYLPQIWARLPLNRAMRGWVIWLLSPKFTVGVVGLVLDDEGRVLLLRHTYRPATPWGLPGGGIKLHEGLEEGLRREILEEAEIEVEVGPLLAGASHVDRRLVDMIFLCHPLPGETIEGFKSNAEIAEARYFRTDALPKGIPAGQRRLIDVALKHAAGDRTSRYEPLPGQPP